jgi:hypothetical protein
VTLLIEPSDSGVRFTTSEWAWSGELHRAVRAFNIRRALIGGGFHGVEIYARGGAHALGAIEPSRDVAHPPPRTPKQPRPAFPESFGT